MGDEDGDGCIGGDRWYVRRNEICESRWKVWHSHGTSDCGRFCAGGMAS